MKNKGHNLKRGTDYKLTNFMGNSVKTGEEEIDYLINVFKADELFLHLEEESEMYHDTGYLKFKKAGIIVTELDYEYSLLVKGLTKEAYLEKQKVDVLHKIGLKLNTYHDLFYKKGNKEAYQNRVNQCIMQIENDLAVLDRELEYNFLAFINQSILENLLKMEGLKTEHLK